MVKVNPKQGRAAAQRRYYLKNRDRLIAKAMKRYEEQKPVESSTVSNPPETPILESSQSSQEPEAQKGLLTKWIQRFRGKKD